MSKNAIATASLADYAAVINDEHRAAYSSAQQAIEHAVKAGVIPRLDLVRHALTESQRDDVRELIGVALLSRTDEGDTVDDFMSHPAFTDMDVRHAHRSGYEQAIAELRHLHRLGYSRVNEIANIMQRHADTLMSEWVQKFDDWIDQWPVSKSLSYEPTIEMPDSWHVMRQRIIARDGGKCVVCESTHRLEVDHIVEVRMGGCPDDDNLRTLCAKCHAERRRG